VLILKNGLCSFKKKFIAEDILFLFSEYKKKQRTPLEYICYGLYLYFFQSFFKKKSDERLSSGFIKRNHVSIWNWIQKYKPKKLTAKRKKIEKIIWL